MVEYYQDVDKRSRAKMVAFLTNHFRYSTMNSWNCSTSYACNMKIYNLGLGPEIADKLYGLLDLSEYHFYLGDLIREFGERHGYIWQAGMNGRSGGYLVLYRGGREPSEYKSYCTSCGQQNYTSVTETGNACGKCRCDSRRDYPSTHMRTFAYPGKDVDMYEDFDEWSLDDLRDRVELVQSFDKLADQMVAEALWIAENYAIEDETVLVEQTRRVLVPAT